MLTNISEINWNKLYNTHTQICVNGLPHFISGITIIKKSQSFAIKVLIPQCQIL